MSIYRCHFLDAAARVAVAEEIEVEALSDAIACARRMLRHRAHHRAIEVWLGARLVYATDSAPAEPSVAA